MKITVVMIILKTIIYVPSVISVTTNMLRTTVSVYNPVDDIDLEVTDCRRYKLT